MIRSRDFMEIIAFHRVMVTLMRAYVLGRNAPLTSIMRGKVTVNRRVEKRVTVMAS